MNSNIALNKKRIAIITLPLSNYNYGGILQAFALQRFIREQFDAAPFHLLREYDLSPSIRIKSKLHQLLFRRLYHNKRTYYRPLKQFIDNEIVLSKPLYSKQALLNELSKHNTDVVITGSDQVWRKKYAFNIANDLFLKFPFKGPRISYAASFGSEDFQDKSLIPYLENLDGISLREEDAHHHLKVLGLNTYHHIDPTLLLDASKYSQIADRSLKDFHGKLVVYMLDKSPEAEQWVLAVARKNGLEIQRIGVKDKVNLSDFKNSHAPVDGIEDWLKAFRDAEFILTDSFHGCVFSLIFKKSFLTVGNEKRGLSRFHSLFNLFSINDRIVNIGTEVDIRRGIDHSMVHEKLKVHIQQAKDYLEKFI